MKEKQSGGNKQEETGNCRKEIEKKQIGTVWEKQTGTDREIQEQG